MKGCDFMKKWAALAGGLSLLLCSTTFAAVQENWVEGIVTVTSEASVQTVKNAQEVQDGTRIWDEYQAEKKVREAAENDARAQLTQYVRAIQVTTTQTVADLMNTDPATAEHVNTLIARANIVKAQQTGDKYEMTMTLPIYGITDSVGRAVLPHIYQQAFLPQGPKDLVVSEATGVIVDCRGLGLKPVMAVTIKDTAGREIYFYQAMLWDKVVRYGMAAWGTDPAVLEKAGNMPIRIRAISLTDQQMTPVISIEDADRILAANDKTGFLRQCAVVLEK